MGGIRKIVPSVKSELLHQRNAYVIMWTYRARRLLKPVILKATIQAVTGRAMGLPGWKVAAVETVFQRASNSRAIEFCDL